MKTLAIFIILVSIQISRTFFRRRRRAPQPVPVDCELSEWETVRSCSADCGPSGEEIQQRRIIRDGRNGGNMCSEYKLERTIICNRVCYNDGRLDTDLSKCVCPPQWTGDCCDKDVDECQQSHPCSQKCVNTLGSYHCDCETNFTLDTDNANCVDLKECQKTPAPCAHRCKEIEEGGYECYCDAGYTLDTDGVKCNDVNECKAENDCLFTCVNIPGDYQCECREGYFRNSDQKTCTDIDECAVNNGDCEQECENTSGGYKCKCGQGYSLNEDNRNCDDLDECESHGQTLCEQLCVNVRGSYSCACVKPYLLNSNMRTCDSQVSEKPEPVTDSPCQSSDESECKAAREEVRAARSGVDKDTMYSWIIGVLIVVCSVLMMLMALLCYRKGYHRLLMPKPPPISTIPRHNNIMFSPDLDEGEASGVYEEPDGIYEELPDSPSYMDMIGSEEDNCKTSKEPEMAENHYEESNYDAEPGPARDSMYVDSNVPDDDDMSRDQLGKECSVRANDGFTFEEDDYENNPLSSNNI